MYCSKSIKHQLGLIDWAILIFFITPSVLMLSFLEPETEWDKAPVDSKYQRLFTPHYEFHPHQYSMDEQLEMFNDISIIAMSYDPLHLSTFPAFFGFKDKANIGEQAPDFIDEKVLDAYGELPNSAYVVDRHGTVVFKSSWVDSKKVEHVIDSLLMFDQEKSRP
jgi:hypothetical protein